MADMNHNSSFPLDKTIYNCFTGMSSASSTRQAELEAELRNAQDRYFLLRELGGLDIRLYQSLQMQMGKLNKKLKFYQREPEQVVSLSIRDFVEWLY